MSDQLKPPAERVAELLAERALSGLTESEAVELRSHGVSPAEEEHWEQIAAAAAVALLHNDCQAMPEHVRERLAAAAPAHVPPAPGPAQAAAAARPSRRWRAAPVLAATGWLAAAVVLIAFVVQGYAPRAVPALDPAAARARLLHEDTEVRTVAWSAGGPQEPAITGDVVWSDARQEGYLRFRGLPGNDPARFQYQLWIFDAKRDERFPVDGGVFDLLPAAGDGDVIVPIRAKLPVGRAVLFALTRERPGGVVVSDRKEIACVAKPG